MDRLEAFRGTHGSAQEEILARHAALIRTINTHEPDTIAEIIEEYRRKGDDAVHALEWVEVPDPLDKDSVFRMQPILHLSNTSEDGESDPAITEVTLKGLLPDGQERVIGIMSTRREYLYLNTSPTADYDGTLTAWEGLDGENFLTLVETAFERQGKESKGESLEAEEEVEMTALGQRVTYVNAGRWIQYTRDFLIQTDAPEEDGQIIDALVRDFDMPTEKMLSALLDRNQAFHDQYGVQILGEQLAALRLAANRENKA